MSGFDDLLDPLFVPPTFQSAKPHVVGTSLNELVSVRDGSGAAIDLSSGFTAVCSPQVDDVSLATFTQTLISGRQIVLGNGTVTLTATPDASLALFATHAGRNAKMTLIVTRTSDGAQVPVWAECNLPLLPRRNP